MTAVSSDVYFAHVPPSSGVTMPYITYHIIDDIPGRHFDSTEDYEQITVQFSVFDDRPSVANINTIVSDLDLVFDRQALVYDNKTHVGCIREGGVGPIQLEEENIWMQTVDYRIIYE